MADQTHHLRDAAIEAGKDAIADWNLAYALGEAELTELVALVLDAAHAALRDIADPGDPDMAVLWQGETKKSYEVSEGRESYIAPPSFSVPPGTHVVVTRKDASV